MAAGSGAASADDGVSDIADPDRARFDDVLTGLVKRGIYGSSEEEMAVHWLAFEDAVSSGDPQRAPEAADCLGMLLTRQADLDRARQAYQGALKSGHPEFAPKAAYEIGVLLLEQGDDIGARHHFQLAVDSGHPVYEAKATGRLGVLLSTRGVACADGLRTGRSAGPPVYHARSLAMLGHSEVVPYHPDADHLTEWAAANDVKVPAAFLEWTSFGGADLLRRYSNDDWFFLAEPNVVTTDHGLALEFWTENQNNFSMAVLLDRGDDPPVVFGWLGEPPWVIHSERFSDCVFAQIFDWQYQLEFHPEDDYKEIAFTAVVYLKSPPSAHLLGERFEPLVTTHFIITDHEGEQRYDEYRYQRSPVERIRVLVKDGGPTELHITGDRRAVLAVEAELLEWFASDNSHATLSGPCDGGQ